MARLQPWDWFIYGLRAFVAFTGGVAFVTIAIQHTKLSTVSFVSSLPILGLLAWVMFRERLRARTWPFIGLSVIGLGLLTGFDLRAWSLGVGELAAIVCMLSFDVGYLMARYHRPEFTNYQNTTILLLLAWVPVLIISLARHESVIPSHVSAGAWFGLVASAIMNITGMVMTNYVFTHMKAYVAGNILLLEGVFALVIGWMLYQEVPTPLELVGAGIILACAYAIATLDARGEPAGPVAATEGTLGEG